MLIATYLVMTISRQITTGLSAILTVSQRRHVTFVKCIVKLLPVFTRSEPTVVDQGVDSGGEGKSKRAEKYGRKKGKERRDSSRRSLLQLTAEN